ncbi:hypothetical protein LOD99_11852 [Oopsacas minuta]|uniref:Transcription factor CBF/NF-Y/archaeal histone domain-containing protein n=1 Tax=Oopsacas minuta TaxID=111878 RepID=A0AAV7JKK1_9METZ|nr:hypothetical protein LOD99_11852 [Oopsacas minuta]
MMTLRLVDNELVGEDAEMEFISYSSNNMEQSFLTNELFDSLFSRSVLDNPLFQYSYQLNNYIDYYSRFLKELKLDSEITLPLEYFRGRTLLSDIPNKLPIPKSSKLPDTLKEFKKAHQLISCHYQKEFPQHSRDTCEIQAERDVVRNVGVDCGIGFVKYCQLQIELAGVNKESSTYSLREQDYLFPITNVSRIMKSVLPGNTKVSTEAKMCMQECVSEFVNFISSEANEICSSQKRKIITTEDVLTAEYNLGFQCSHYSLAAFSNQIKKL